MITVFERCLLNSRVFDKDLRYLDAECFPDDKPLRIKDATRWWILYPDRYSSRPVAFCGFRPLGDQLGFHTRAGVLPEARGQGLQKFMIHLREDAMRKAGLETAITYTEAYSAASMNSLISCGYRVFEGNEDTGLVLDNAYWKTMVYWKKTL